ncbi:MAG: dihydroorotate dehydrogenase electron transfer subunit [Mailhella sp.]|nr:dihydroorotate dehydrogenase electron transfer subunit [Mailhella sp.]
MSETEHITPERSVLRVKGVRRVSPAEERGLYMLDLAHPGWEKWRGGQFFMLRPLSWGGELLWARPFSICMAAGDTLSVFFQAAGRGTDRMSGLVPGDEVMVWGPLGNGFAVEPERRTFLLAGGIGIAPFAEYVRLHPAPGNVSMLFCHRPPLSCYPAADLLQKAIRFASNREMDGSGLERSLALTDEALASAKACGGLVLACGPMPYLRHVWQKAMDIRARVQLSLENRMACGVGACLGCVAKTTPHWSKAGLPAQVCTKGPVFWAEDLDLNGEKQ